MADKQMTPREIIESALTLVGTRRYEYSLALKAFTGFTVGDSESPERMKELSDWMEESYSNLASAARSSFYQVEDAQTRSTHQDTIQRAQGVLFLLGDVLEMAALHRLRAIKQVDELRWGITQARLSETSESLPLKQGEN